MDRWIYWIGAGLRRCASRIIRTAPLSAMSALAFLNAMATALRASVPANEIFQGGLLQKIDKSSQHRENRGRFNICG
jgi:hypothetical protein